MPSSKLSLCLSDLHLSKWCDNRYTILFLTRPDSPKVKLLKFTASFNRHIKYQKKPECGGNKIIMILKARLFLTLEFTLNWKSQCQSTPVQVRHKPIPTENEGFNEGFYKKKEIALLFFYLSSTLHLVSSSHPLQPPEAYRAKVGNIIMA